MESTILEKAGALFIQLGYKSVTMDDIAKEMGISKKTLYKYFKNKEVLVDKCTDTIQDTIQERILAIIAKDFNPIKEKFEIKKMFREMFKKASSSPIYQLKKYYPKTYDSLIKKQRKCFWDCIKNNIEKGISMGYYRDNFAIDHYIEFYFTLVFHVNEKAKTTQVHQLEIEALEYHTRAMATPKGVQELEKLLSNYTL